MTTRPESDTLVELQEQARSAEQSGNTHAAQQIWLAILQIDPSLDEARAELDRLAAGGGAPAAAEPAPAAPSPSLGHEAAPAASATTPPQPAPSQPTSPSSGPEDSGLDLQLDLDAVPDAAPPPSGPPEFDVAPPREEPLPAAPGFDDEAQPSVADLLGAADEVSSEISGTQSEARDELAEPEGTPLENLLTNATPDEPSVPESVDPRAAELVAQARAALEDGQPSVAVELAARAMAIQDDLPEANEIAETARAESARRADIAEMRMTEAIAEMDAGRPEQARPRLLEVLEAIPGHPEATEYLQRCGELIGDDGGGAGASGSAEFGDASSCGLDDISPDGLPSIPLSGPQGAPSDASPAPDLSTGPTGAAPPPVPDFDVSTGPTGAAPPPPLTDSGDLGDLGDPLADHAADAPPPPPAMADAPPPPLPDAPPPVSSGPEPAADLPETPALPSVKGLRARGTKTRKGIGVGGLGRVAIFAVVLIALGAGGFFAAKTLGLIGGADQVAVAAPNPRPTPVPSAERAAAAQADQVGEEVRGQETSGAGEAEAGGGTSAQPAPELVFAPSEVPRVREDARAALANGREERAVELLTAAVAAIPGDFELARELQQARNALAEREESVLAIEKGRSAFAEGNYEDALRVFYRIPDPYRPRGIDRWIGAGWYNLGVRALQNEQIPEARRFFADCLEMLPGDEEAKAHREVARRYSRGSVDDAYRMYVRSLRMRSLPSH